MLFTDYQFEQVILADRFLCESSAEDIYSAAVSENIALLVVGDPLCATTHTDIILRAKEAGIPVEVVHNASVMGAVASCGLQVRPVCFKDKSTSMHIADCACFFGRFPQSNGQLMEFDRRLAALPVWPDGVGSVF